MNDFEKMRAESYERNISRLIERDRQRLAAEAEAAKQKAEYEKTVDLMFAHQRMINEFAAKQVMITRMLTQCSDALEARSKCGEALTKEEADEFLHNFRVMEAVAAPMKKIIDDYGIMDTVYQILEMQDEEIADRPNQCQCASQGTDPDMGKKADDIPADHVARAA